MQLSALGTDPSIVRAAAPSTRKPIHYPGLDGIRTLAVAVVFLYHFMMRVFPWGWVGVQLFFVLSGFLITGILFGSQNDEHRFKKFYSRRALRIFPLYYGLLAVWTVITKATHGTFPGHFWLWWVYVQNFFYLLSGSSPNELMQTGGGHAIAAIGHLWSLAVEEQFYFIWPLVVFLVKDRRRLMQLCCLGILLRLGLAAYWQTHLSPATLQLGVTYRMLPTQCDGFLMGGFLALWLRGEPSQRVLRLSGIFAAISVLGYAALILVLHRVPRLLFGQDVFDFNQGFQATIGIPLANLASAFLLLATLRPATWAYRLFTLRPMVSLGKVSYGLYFYHLPVYVVCAAMSESLYLRLGSHGRENIWHSVLATLVTVFVSYLSFYVYERPFLRLKDALRFTPISAPASIPASPSLNPAPETIPVASVAEAVSPGPTLTFK